MQSQLADSLLAGIERAVTGMKGFSRPEKWDQVQGKLGTNPTVLKLSVLFGDKGAIKKMEGLVRNARADPVIRRDTLNILIESNASNLKSLCVQALDDSEMRGMAARGLAKFADMEIGKKLISRLEKFADPERDRVVEILCGRVAWARLLIARIEAGKISKSLISPYHVSQIKALKDNQLHKRLEKTWGIIRTSSSALTQKKQDFKQEFTILGSGRAANLSHGRHLYEQRCASCHVLYGQGGKLGPDLTGSGRSNLDYLLENIVDPNAAVSADYRMHVIEMKDGRILSGMIVGQDRNSLTLRMPDSELVVSKSTISQREALADSIMPVGLLDNLSREGRRDLLAYLMHPSQIPVAEGL